MSRSYKNPPLIEAIFEIRFPAELSIECQRDKFYEKIRNDYPQILVPIVMGEPPSLKSYEFTGSEGKKIIRCSINTFSIHTNEYEGFARFKEDCLKYTQLFTKLYSITSLKRTGLRYINHIPIVRIEGCIPIQKYRTESKSLIHLPFFTSYSYTLKKPLPIVIERGINPDIFLIGNEELNKYGVGLSKEEALKEFEDFIITDYRTLRESSPGELTEDAKELLVLYDSYIEL